MADRGQRSRFASLAPVKRYRDTVVVACVAGDAVGWLMEQMNEYDSLVVCLSTGIPLVWWTWLAGARATLNEEHGGTLGDAGSTAESTVSALVRAGSRSAEIGHGPGLVVAAAWTRRPRRGESRADEPGRVVKRLIVGVVGRRGSGAP